MSKKKDTLEAACYAHSNLNTFASLVTILEGGHIYGGNPRTELAITKIVSIAQTEQQALLREYDCARAAITPGPADREGGR